MPRTDTLLQHLAEDRESHHGAVVPPLYQNALFTFDDWEAIDTAFSRPAEHYIYTRGNNPTVEIVEKKLAAMAGGEKAQLFPSGMGAIAAAAMSCLKSGDHVITIKSLYGPASNLLQKYLQPKFGIEVTYVEGTDIAQFEAALQPNTTLIFLESPSSAVLSLQDLEAVAQLARPRGIRTIIDNTWATMVYQQPLALGIDLEVHSCSKYICGHSDVIAGVVIGRAADIDAISGKEMAWLGAKPAPFEAWLLLRSLRTLTLRLERHQASALRVAQMLEAHPAVAQVYYPGLASYPQKALAERQMQGNTGLLSFRLKTEELNEIKAFVNGLQVFTIGISWGGHESLVFAPTILYTKLLTPEQFKEMGISQGIIRISIGLEAVEDLLEDLKQGLDLLIAE